MNSIIGHEEIVGFLSKSIKNNRLAHAYLFVGPEHIGKTAVATWFADQVLGGNRKNHPDFTEILRERDEKTEKLKKNISVEQIRDLNSRLTLSSFLNSYKVALIPEAEALNSASANSFLKTLEEPRGKTIIILCARAQENLLPTIVSRCQVINFSLVRKDEIYRALLKQCATEEKAKNFSQLSLGRPGIALKFLHDEKFFKAHQEEVERCCKLIMSSLSDRLLNLEEYFQNKISLQDQIEKLNKILWIWSSLFRDVIYIKEGCEENISNYFAKKQIKNLVSTFTLFHAANIIEEIEKTREYFANNVNPRLAFENLVLNF